MGRTKWTLVVAGLWAAGLAVAACGPDVEPDGDHVDDPLFPYQHCARGGARLVDLQTLVITYDDGSRARLDADFDDDVGSFATVLGAVIDAATSAESPDARVDFVLPLVGCDGVASYQLAWNEGATVRAEVSTASSAGSFRQADFGEAVVEMPVQAGDEARVGVTVTSEDGEQCTRFQLEAVVRCGAEEEVCADAVDNDLDLLVDCDDPSCAADDRCLSSAEDCSDGVDNDGDGAVDCADSDCANEERCTSLELCTNGQDDDRDGAVDCADSDCADDPACGTAELCDNGVDDDEDLLVDCEDVDCVDDPSCEGTACGLFPDVDASQGYELFVNGPLASPTLYQGPNAVWHQLPSCPSEYTITTTSDAADTEIAIFAAEDIGSGASPILVPRDGDTWLFTPPEPTAEFFVVVTDTAVAAECRPLLFDLEVDNGDGFGSIASPSSAFSPTLGEFYARTFNPAVNDYFVLPLASDADEAECPIVVEGRVLEEDVTDVALSVLIDAMSVAIADTDAGDGGAVSAEFPYLATPYDPADVTRPDAPSVRFTATVPASQTPGVSRDTPGRPNDLLVLAHDRSALKRTTPAPACLPLTLRFARRCDLPSGCAALDCGDPDCAALPECADVEPEVCDNSEDDDRDGRADCEDPDCAEDPACVTPEECTNGVDDDGDDAIDCADSDCRAVCCASESGEAPGGYGEALFAWLLPTSRVGVCMYDACGESVNFDGDAIHHQLLSDSGQVGIAGMQAPAFLYPFPVPSALPEARVRAHDLFDLDAFECPAAPTGSAEAEFDASIPNLIDDPGVPMVFAAGTTEPVCGATWDAACPAERQPSIHVLRSTCSPEEDAAAVRVIHMVPNAGPLDVEVTIGGATSTLATALGYGEASTYVTGGRRAESTTQVDVALEITDSVSGDTWSVSAFDFVFPEWNATERVRVGQCVAVVLSGLWTSGRSDLDATAMLESPQTCTYWPRSDGVAPSLWPTCAE